MLSVVRRAFAAAEAPAATPPTTTIRLSGAFDVEVFLTERVSVGARMGLHIETASPPAGDDLTEEIVFDDAEIDDADESLEDISLDLEEEEEGDVGMKTEPIADEDLFADEALADEAVAEEAVADEEIAEVDDDILIGSDENEGIEEDFSDEPSRRTPVKKSRAAASAEEEVTEGPAFLGVMVVSSLVLLIGVLVMVDIASSNPSPMVEWLVGMFK